MYFSLRLTRRFSWPMVMNTAISSVLAGDHAVDQCGDSGQIAEFRFELRMSDHVDAEQVLHGLQPVQAWFCHGSVEMRIEFATYRVRRCAGDAHAAMAME